jgi:OmcA/MtrC family decaheme c-type cytochrome
MRIALVVSLLAAAACEGPTGPAGAPGTDGSPGSSGSPGAPGAPGNPAAPSPWLTAPGVQLTITGTTVSATGATVAFKLTDVNGVPLDRTGRLTTSKVNVAVVLAQLAEQPDGSPAQYTAYTTNAAAQAATEGVEANFTAVDVTAGTYTYKLAAPLTGLDPTKTQTALVVVDRTVAGVQTFDRQTFSVRPAGGAANARQLVTDATCDSCHKTFALHGGRYASPTQCVLCHQPQSVDPDTGNTVDFKVMIHKIHRGAGLPSVLAGTPYRIIGFAGSVHDFSTVVYPQPIARCESCHAGAQADRWKSTVTKVACGSCHDGTVFAASDVVPGKTLHRGGEQPSETSCPVCHGPGAVVAPVLAAHYTGLLDPAAPAVTLQIQSITNTGPGQAPVLTFRAQVNGVGRDLGAAPFNRLTATIAGPTTDFATAWQARIQGTGAVGTLAAVDAANGVFAYTFPASAAIPPSATGSYQVGLEGFIQATPTAPRFAAFNPIATFAVTDATAQPRRAVVGIAQCNGCHNQLSAHGGARQNPAYCVMCHNPAAIDNPSPRFEGGSVLAEALDFRVMIHKLHRGENLTADYAIGGDAPTPANPAGAPTVYRKTLPDGSVVGTRYPRTTADCGACHTSKNWTLPLAASPAYAPSTTAEYTCSEPAGADANNYCDDPFWTITATTKLPPQTSVCTSCHDAPFTAAHAATNTTAAGLEACAACHGPGKVDDVSLFHAQ